MFFKIHAGGEATHALVFDLAPGSLVDIAPFACKHLNAGCIVRQAADPRAGKAGVLMHIQNIVRRDILDAPRRRLRFARGQRPFGVVRRGGGNGDVHVTKPDGRKRIISFEAGKAVGADTSEADPGRFSASKAGDMSTVRIGTETYQIPDAAVSGG